MKLNAIWSQPKYQISDGRTKTKYKMGGQRPSQFILMWTNKDRMGAKLPNPKTRGDNNYRISGVRAEAQPVYPHVNNPNTRSED